MFISVAVIFIVGFLMHQQSYASASMFFMFFLILLIDKRRN